RGVVTDGGGLSDLLRQGRRRVSRRGVPRGGAIGQQSAGVGGDGFYAARFPRAPRSGRRSGRAFAPRQRLVGAALRAGERRTLVRRSGNALPHNRRTNVRRSPAWY